MINHKGDELPAVKLVQKFCNFSVVNENHVDRYPCKLQEENKSSSQATGGNGYVTSLTRV